MAKDQNFLKSYYPSDVVKKAKQIQLLAFDVDGVLTDGGLYYDHEGNLARKGSINKIILNQSLENFYDNQISSKKSFDISDFDLSFVRGLSLEDGAATLTEFTAEICSKKIFDKTKVLLDITSSLYFHPPTTTNNSNKINTLTIRPVGICVDFLPINHDCFCSETFNIITTNKNNTATAPT